MKNPNPWYEGHAAAGLFAFRPGRIILLATMRLERPAPEVCYVCPELLHGGEVPGTSDSSIPGTTSPSHFPCSGIE